MSEAVGPTVSHLLVKEVALDEFHVIFRGGGEFVLLFARMGEEAYSLGGPCVGGVSDQGLFFPLLYLQPAIDSSTPAVVKIPFSP